ncbi:anthranilate phosphoribosyltransferase [Gordonia effusa NBRC 100432]|uniref:Anthranilate phosphoribosyltransferase n=1 Tax=Gordonia effusa NBRC 100432 TaxID=1077974 RepID=H0QV28_9ACTN|nr:anthranilate phosphoribosyltransferase [Gordonia effusa]GAB16679.1 anthranilate phosphoribosyltransferase [Gordonia effusa NBRC 100432]
MTASASEQFTWPQILGSVADGHDLDVEQARWAMNEIMTDSATSAQIAAFAVAVKMKGAAPAELRGLAEAMLSHATLVDVSRPAVDIVGTGGDRSHTVNISTMSSLVVAASGLAVVKHGNRASSSKSGGADVLEALGVKIDQSAAQVEQSVNELGIGFCFAAAFHPAYRFTGPPRKEIGIPTVFNVLGPLTNPASPQAGLIGCAFGDLAPVLAQTFADRGNSVLVVRGDDGLDELTTTGTSTVWQVVDGRVTVSTVDPRDLDIDIVELSALRGGDATVNAGVARDLFAGARGPVRDAVLLNSAGAIVAAEQTGPLAGPALNDALRAGMKRAAAAIDSGAVTALLDDWIVLTNR